MKPLFPIALAVIAALASTPAQAEAKATVVLSNLRFELIDLTPNDGVAPRFTLTSAGGSLVDAAVAGARQGDRQVLEGATTFAPLNASAALSFAQAQAAVWADGLSVSGFAIGSGAQPDDRAQFGATTQPWDSLGGGQLTLSANSLLRIRIDVSQSLSTSVGYDPAGAGSWEYAIASAHLNVVGAGPLGVDTQESYDATYQMVGNFDPSGGPFGPEFASVSRTLEISFANRSAGDLNGRLQLGAAVSGESSVSPVPEPASVALMLAGLTAVGWRARRRG